VVINTTVFGEAGQVAVKTTAVIRKAVIPQNALITENHLVLFGIGVLE
jgi:hypothetical protein|tara:strand:+ start:608 stop:751 length:144 start_codon:yes stop_codon:yes gene_type:complete